MLYLKSVERINPQAPEEAAKFYASAIHDVRVELDSLATMVAQRCSMQRADVHGVLVALMDIIPDQLLDGNIVALGDLGSFYASVSSDGVASEEELSTTMIRGIKIQYRPTNELKKKLRMLDFSFAS